MNENNKQPFKMSVPSMNCIAVITVVGKLIFQRVGTYANYYGGRYSMMELLGIGIPLLILIVPIFYREYRETCWNKKTLIITIGILVVSALLITIMYANKNYYYTLWFKEGGWTRENCPPIRWDFWNIIGKTA